MSKKVLFWHFIALGRAALLQDGGNVGSLLWDGRKMGSPHLSGTNTSFKYTRKLFTDALTNSRTKGIRYHVTNPLSELN